MDVFCGIDWAEDHHDIALVDRDGQAAGPPPDQRRRGRARRAAGPARRARRQRRGPDPGGDRDPARAADRLPARHRPQGLPDQPDGGGPLPGPALDRGPQIRPRRRGRAGEHLAHRPGTRTGRCPPIPSSPRRSRCWPAPSKTPSGTRTAAHNKLRSHLREYYPGFLAAFADARGGIIRPEARAILAAAPDPGRRRQRSPSPSCAPCCARPAAAAASTPKPPGCARPSAHPRCASSRWSRRPWARQALALLAPAERRLRQRRRPRAGRHRVF